MEYTAELYTKDGRTKSGKRLVSSVSFMRGNEKEAVEYADSLVYKDDKLTYELHESFREVRNIMTGEVVMEHYRTPYCCSVASEAYWCN